MKNLDFPSSSMDSKSLNYTVRPYQKEAIGITVQHTNSLIRQSLERENTPVFDTAALLEMATGSGKTFTVGQYLEKIITIRDRFNRRYQVKNFQWLNILVLTNRIDGLNQFRDDLVHGKTWEKPKAPIIWKSIRENFRVKTFHSKADNLSDIDESYFTRDESDEDEIFSKQNGRIKDNLSFSTFQTAIRKDLAYKMKDIDLIIIDEAHNVKPEDEYSSLLEDLVTLGRDGHTPMILAVTATPTNLTKEAFGEAISKFGLAQYIASEYSPDIRYNLVSATSASATEIRSIKDKVEQAKQEHNILSKRAFVREIQQDFDIIMASYPDMYELVQDLIKNRIWTDPKTVGQTTIFANNIRETDEIARIMNEQYGTEVAISYHSSNDSKQSVSWSDNKQSWLERFAHHDDQIRIIVCVDKLNESVDVPTIKNVVFWRGTDVAKIFLQQFGRGLRGDGTVNYYDYIWGIRNFAWIGEIYEQWSQITTSRGPGTWDGPHTPGFQLLGGSTGWEDNHIDLSDLGFSIVELVSYVDSIGIATASQIRSLWRDGIITKTVFSHRKWPEFAKSWNNEHPDVGYTLPLSSNGLIGILSGNNKVGSTEYIISLLDETEFKIEENIRTLPTPSQLRFLWKNGSITEGVLSWKKWTKFAKSWNNEHPDVGYTLPTSGWGLIGMLSGDTKIAKIEYIISLLNETEFEIKEIKEVKAIATIFQICSLWRDGIITKKVLSHWKWPEFAKSWNTTNLTLGYRLPVSIKWLIGALWGKIDRSKSTESIVSLLDEIDFMRK
jgi:superfamily II DNA or RNA helicase